MHKLLKKRLLIGIVGSMFFFLLPQISSAAKLNFEVVRDDIAKDGTILVDVNIDPQSKRLNVIEGTIKFEGEGVKDLSVEVLNGESILTIWPTVPAYISKENAIRFTGGVPGGFDKEGLLFRMRLTSSLAEDVTVYLDDGVAYLNDGKGTKEIIPSKSFVVNIDISDKSVMGNSSLNVIIVIVIAGFLLFFIYKYANKKFIKK